MKIWGLGLIALALAAPLFWLVDIAAGRDIVALFSQYLGMAALIAMAFGQLIATRWLGVETVFGPMDKAYRLHKWLGIGAMAAILLHDTIDAEMRGLGEETLLVEAAETAGEISLYGLLILVVITVATFIPYHLWKWTHRLIGVFFVLGAAHYLFILKPFSNGDPLGVYMAVVCAVGLAAYLYTSAPRGLRPTRAFRIAEVNRQGAATAVEMTPVGAPLRHKAGQFGFFAFTGAGLAEPHPFTISSAPREDGSLRVTIAPLGDLTSYLIQSLEKGQSVQAQGPYGRFASRWSGPELWVAAGVGVTPFVALAEAMPAEAPPVTMIYSARSRDVAAHLDHLQRVEAERKSFRLELWESGARGRLTGDAVRDLAGAEFSQMTVRYCGPAALREAMMRDLGGHGLPANRFHFEEFEIRSGLGLRRLANWLRQRISTG